jgi:hypothetical protein
MPAPADPPLRVSDLVVWPARAAAPGAAAPAAPLTAPLGAGSLLAALALSVTLALASLLLSPMAPALGAGIGHFGFGPLAHLTCGAL